MSVFDLLFIMAFFATVVTLFVAALSAIHGRGARAIHLLRGCAICAAVYLGIVALVSLFGARHVLNIGNPRCFDDWCIAVENVRRQPVNAGISYMVTLQISSHAQRVSQRENGVVVYLTDDSGRRYDPVPDNSAVPLNVLLGPEESVAATRSFEVPADARETGLIITHEGGFPIGWFIIGYETCFRKPTIVRLP
jgi:hypothetical protein